MVESVSLKQLVEKMYIFASYRYKCISATKTERYGKIYTLIISFDCLCGNNAA